MTQSVEVREKIRHVLQDIAHTEPEIIDDAVDRIMDLVDPFRQLALQDLERFRPTFLELSK